MFSFCVVHVDPINGLIAFSPGSESSLFPERKTEKSEKIMIYASLSVFIGESCRELKH
jgi:hypothetical protein